MKLPTFECLRCGHRWHPKKEEKPRCCGFCKSPYWTVPPERDSAAKERHEMACTMCKAG